MKTKKEHCEKTVTMEVGTKLLKTEELLQIRGGFPTPKMGDLD